jgi:hypothetical protein
MVIDITITAGVMDGDGEILDGEIGVIDNALPDTSTTGARGSQDVVGR